MADGGKVVLVGAGPGDPGLLTLRGQRFLQQADAVVYDRLIDQRLLEHAGPQAELIDAGKGRGQHRMTQEEINHLLVEMAREGKRVVRLKGGDPFVFGRGGEEGEHLAKEDIPFEVVPGVTSAVAAPAYAGIPLTHRAIASSFTVVSGSEDPTRGHSFVDWKALAGGRGTLVILMGWENLPGILETLVREGMAPSTPIALVEWGSQPYQRTAEGTLENVVERARQMDMAAPVTAIVGQVVTLRRHLAWFDKKPLLGRRVLVTRTRSQAGALSDLLREEGAEPIEVPTIQVKLLDDAIALKNALDRLKEFHWVVFTSVNGVDAFFTTLTRRGDDARALGGLKVCAIGPTSAQALAARGIRADLAPQEHISEGIVEAMSANGVSGQRVLIPGARGGREVLGERLKRLGAHVEEVETYYSAVPLESRAVLWELLNEKEVDIATFTSSSTVRNLASLLDGDLSPLEGVAVACIGPATAQAAQDAGFKVAAVAKTYTVPGLVQAVLDIAQS